MSFKINQYRIPKVKVFRRIPGSVGVKGAMITECFLNYFTEFCQIHFNSYKNQFVKQVNHKNKTSNLSLLQIKKSEVVLNPLKEWSLIKNNIQRYKINFVPSKYTERTRIQILGFTPILDIKNKTDMQGGEANIFDKCFIGVMGLKDKWKLSRKILHVDIPVVNLENISLTELTFLQNKYGFKYFSYDKNININLGNPYPIFSTVVTIGEKYVSEYLFGNDYGIYIEQHEMPHVHRPMTETSKGYMLYGKKNDNQTFEFIFVDVGNKGWIYTHPYSWHADCYLTGQWEVMYSPSGDNCTLTLESTREI